MSISQDNLSFEHFFMIIYTEHLKPVFKTTTLGKVIFYKLEHVF